MTSVVPVRSCKHGRFFATFFKKIWHGLFLGMGAIGLYDCLGGGAGAAAEAQSLESDTAYGGICYRGSVGFVIGPPEGWVNLPETAAASGLCFMFVPAGYNFDNAPAVIYPNTGDTKGDAGFVEILSEGTLQQMRRLPGGENTELLRGEPFVSACNLDFQPRYFNNGPSPNNFELVVYHIQDEVILLVVLSAKTEQARQDYLDDFMRMLDDIFPLQISWSAE